jgi:pimeloyl-ACP methyl ester carboxylesterase
MGKLSSLVLISSLAACGGGGGSKPDAPVHNDSAPMVDAPVETLGPPPALAIACNDALADIYTLPSNLPTMDDSHRGDILRCAPTESLSQYKVNAQIGVFNAGYSIAEAGAATSGFWTFRFAYRSERNTVNANRAEGDTAAILLVPEKPLANAPLIIFGHGSVGVAPKCGPTHYDLSSGVIDEDYPPALLRLAGAGYTVIAPDYNGFAYGQAPGYFNAEDEAHAILDATRAATHILPQPPAKIALIGHSQGGHAVVAAQSYAASYGHDGTIVGVAAFAPLWASLDLFAAATTPTAGLMTSTDPYTIMYAMEYAYSAEELRVGAGHGGDVFMDAKKQAAEDVFLNECYDTAALQALGATPADFFDSTYVNNVGGACALQGTCTDTLTMMWKPFWDDDRPHLDPDGPPMLVITGGADTFVTPGRAQCGRNHFDADISGGSTTIQYCQDANAGHRDLVRTADVDYALSWVNAKAGIGSAPPACTPPNTTTCTVIPKDL